MKILAISDIHNRFKEFAVEKLPDADVCLIAGDLTENGMSAYRATIPHDKQPFASILLKNPILRSKPVIEVLQAQKWLEQLSERYPVFWIPGNHDRNIDCATFGQLDNCQCILNRTTTFGGLTIHGVSLSPCYNSPELAKYWDYMTCDPAEEAIAFDFEPVDIVVSHSPVYGHCDALFANPYDLSYDNHIGSRSLLEYVQRNTPRLVLCGHIHEARGHGRIKTETGTTLVVNAACCAVVIHL